MVVSKGKRQEAQIKPSCCRASGSAILAQTQDLGNGKRVETRGPEMLGGGQPRQDGTCLAGVTGVLVSGSHVP